jgi:formylglycine-generating enzyme required for sulfatase activity
VGGGGTTGGEGESGAAGTGESGGSGGEGGTPEPIDRCLDPALRGPALVAIPAGTATIGAEDLNEYTIPVHDVPLAAYCIDRTEVTVAHYRECVEGTVAGCAPPDLTFGDCNWEMPDNDAHPVSCIDWPRADAYCRWAGKRLPTEAEWEHVANQGTGALYPWGDEPADPALGNFFNSVATTTVVGSYPDGATPTGVFDLAGNVWEWTGDAFCEDYSPGATCDTNNHAARGGSFASASEDFVRAAYRDPDSDGSGRFGFRCALSH